VCYQSRQSYYSEITFTAFAMNGNNIFWILFHPFPHIMTEVQQLTLIDKNKPGLDDYDNKYT
jgi:hypothetical protein